MTKDEAISKAGGASKLAALLGVTPQAISKWADIPELRMFQLKVLKPRWFRRPKDAQ